MVMAPLSPIADNSPMSGGGYSASASWESITPVTSPAAPQPITRSATNDTATGQSSCPRGDAKDATFEPATYPESPSASFASTPPRTMSPNPATSLNSTAKRTSSTALTSATPAACQPTVWRASSAPTLTDAQKQNPAAWENPALAKAYEKLKGSDGQLARSDVTSLLVLAGRQRPAADAVEAVTSRVLPYSNFGPVEAFNVWSEYDAEVRTSWSREFWRTLGRPQSPADARCNSTETITFEQLEGLLDKLNFAPLRDTITEVAREAASTLLRPEYVKARGPEAAHLLQEGRMSELGFQRFTELMTDREGFAASEIAIVEEAFNRYDSDRDGYLNPSETKPLASWLSFGLKGRGDEFEEMLDEIFEESDSSPQLGITFKDFVRLLRKHRSVCYRTTKQSFDVLADCVKEDGSGGFIGPFDMVRLCKDLSINLLPEPFLEAVTASELDPERFTFWDAWKILKRLRATHALTVSEVDASANVFKLFDSQGRGKLYSRQAWHALRWCGYLLNCKDNRTHVVDWSSLMSSTGHFCQESFVALVSQYHEVDLEYMRTFFRAFAEDGGAKKLHKKKIRSALKRLNSCYIDDYRAWLRSSLPSKWLFSDNSGLDFEDFRRLVTGCRERECERLRRHHGFTDTEVARLRIVFVKFAPDGANAPIGPAGQSKLFKTLIPAISSCSEARNRVKKSLEVAGNLANGMTWPAFLQVMRRHADLLELDEESRSQRVMEELGVPVKNVNTFFDIYYEFTAPRNAIDENGPASLEPFAPEALQILAGRRAPLDKESLDLFKETLMAARKNKPQVVLTMDDFITMVASSLPPG
eukprot:TRINITY_DN26610_c0_g1_i1.p1 TRINITY_DN26610_c0_g1~~TRINITY_DN26610_c0_g1_i1.p1  ORF type:complete len:817 (+),score=119.58 TRINITY_DN26610_c0_g1_i1:104-2554(+)